MSFLKVFFLGAVFLFASLGLIGWWKKTGAAKPSSSPVQEIALPLQKELPAVASSKSEEPPTADRIGRLFALDASKLPIVETLSYTSRVPWLKDRPAWIADYASHYSTSRHFIARSLNQTVDYWNQKVSLGDRFNVFKRDQHLQFYAVIDLSRCKLWFYYVDLDKKERVLLKTYSVGVGRLDPQRRSGSLTPVGKYLLGEKVALYKPGVFGLFQEQKTEMIRVFGTRWIPFDKELEGCTEGAKGLGLHGAPWVVDAKGDLVEDLTKIGKYDSDGCVRLAAKDIEEIFSIAITWPTVVEIVKEFYDAELPGVEGNP